VSSNLAKLNFCLKRIFVFVTSSSVNAIVFVFVTSNFVRAIIFVFLTNFWPKKFSSLEFHFLVSLGQYVVRSVQYVVYSVQYTICNVPCTIYEIRFTNYDNLIHDTGYMVIYEV